MQWWNDLSLLQQIFFCIATPATLIMIIQTILVAIGLHGGDVDVGDGDIGADGDSGLGTFIVRGLIAFFTVAGWVGVGLGETSMHEAWIVVISVVLGALAFVGMAFLIKGILKLQEQGNLDYRNCLGKTAKVYIPIPPNREGVGKITLTFQERFSELDAMSDDDEKLPTDSLVIVKELIDTDTVLVTKFVPSEQAAAVADAE